MGLGARLGVMQRLLRGTHVGHPKVEAVVDREARAAASTRRPTYETDGEWNRARSAELTIECLPRALSVLVPAP